MEDEITEDKDATITRLVADLESLATALQSYKDRASRAERRVVLLLDHIEAVRTK